MNLLYIFFILTTASTIKPMASNTSEQVLTATESGRSNQNPISFKPLDIEKQQENPSSKVDHLTVSYSPKTSKWSWMPLWLKKSLQWGNKSVISSNKL